MAYRTDDKQRDAPDEQQQIGAAERKPSAPGEHGIKHSENDQDYSQELGLGTPVGSDRLHVLCGNRHQV